jgi:hypothetical protein
MQVKRRHETLIRLAFLACACDPDGRGTNPASTASSTEAGRDTGPSAELVVAMVGDMGKGDHGQAVYQRVLDEGADLLIILGDFGDSPSTWSEKMNAMFGDSFPIFGVIGNHDSNAWSGYQSQLAERLAKVPGVVCTGELGVAASCTYRGLHVVLSGIGTVGSRADHEKYIAHALAVDASPWSLCAWHRNQRDLQAGDKSDDVGWPAFRSCQDDGSFIVMGHEHSYARTRTLTEIGNKDHGHGAIGRPDLLGLGPGRTFTAVSGLGGKSIRPFDASLHKDDTWWATLFTSNYYRRNGVEIEDFTAENGVLFLRFNVDGPSVARGYFKTVRGEMIDEFAVLRE